MMHALHMTLTTQLDARPTTRSWQERAIMEYTATVGETQLRQRLAQRLLALTGRHISEQTIATDTGVRRAAAQVDGVQFVQRGDDLVVVGPCAYCTTGSFESAPITNSADLGHTLAAWQPYHRDCEPTDPNDDVSW